MPEMLTRNLGLKLVALALAFTLWAALTGQQPLPQDYTVPLSVEIDKEQAYAAQPPTQVRLRLTGAQSQMRGFDAVGLVARVDLRGRPPGRHDIQLGRTNIDGVPSRVTLESIDPDRVIVLTDERRRRELPVRPTLLDEPTDGSHVYSVRGTPERVIVEGPATAIDAIDAIPTDPISLTGRERPFSATVSAAPETPMITVRDSGAIDVRVVIDAAPVSRRFDSLRVVVLGGAAEADRVTIVPSEVDVELTGPPRLLERLSAAQIRVGVDLTAVLPGGRSQRVTVNAEVLDLPVEQHQKVQVTVVRPGQVTVRVEPASAADGSAAGDGGIT